MRNVNFIIFCSIFSFLFAGCSKNSQTEEPSPIEVTTFLVTPADIPAVFKYVGVAASSHPVEIRARVEGYLIKIGYEEGSFVYPNSLLFQIDPEPFQVRLDAAKAELAKHEAVLWNAKVTENRLKPLYEQRAASLKDYEDAIAQRLAAEAQVEVAKANVHSEWLNLSYTTIVSPIAGLSNKANFREGSLITPNVNGLLTTVSIIDPIWVNFSVSNNDMIKFRQQSLHGNLQMPKDMNFDVYLQLADGTKFPLKGTVSFAAPILDPKTGTMLVRSVFPNPNNVIRPGEYLAVSVWGAIYPNALFVPQDAVMETKKGSIIFVVNQDNKAEPRLVELGDWFKDYWIIKSGLKQGDTVIVSGINKIQPGTSVKIKCGINYDSP